MLLSPFVDIIFRFPMTNRGNLWSSRVGGWLADRRDFMALIQLTAYKERSLICFSN